jgi:hypothetical protein
MEATMLDKLALIAKPAPHLSTWLIRPAPRRALVRRAQRTSAVNQTQPALIRMEVQTLANLRSIARHQAQQPT